MAEVAFQVLLLHKPVFGTTKVQEHASAIGFKCGDGPTNWYECIENRIIHAMDDAVFGKVERVGEFVAVAGSPPLQDYIDDFNARWIQAHPFYAVNRETSQLYIADFLRMFTPPKQVPAKRRNVSTKLLYVGAGLAVGVVARLLVM